MNMLLAVQVFQTALLVLIAAGTAYLVFGRIRGSGQSVVRGVRQKRRAMYQEVVRVLSVLGQKGDIQKNELVNFRARTQDAGVVFDGEIAAFIDEIYARGVKLTSTNELLKGTTLPVGEERDRITVENARQLIWLADQLAMLGKKFQRYPDIQ